MIILWINLESMISSSPYICMCVIQKILFKIIIFQCLFMSMLYNKIKIKIDINNHETIENHMRTCEEIKREEGG